MTLTYWMKIRIYLDELWQECEEGCKFVFKEMKDISKKKEISRRFHFFTITFYGLPDGFEYVYLQ